MLINGAASIVRWQIDCVESEETDILRRHLEFTNLIFRTDFCSIPIFKHGFRSSLASRTIATRYDPVDAADD